MLIRFTTPCVLGTTEYASGAEADLAPDVANMALSLGRGVRVMPEETPPAPASSEAPAPSTVPEPLDAGSVQDEGARPKRR